MSSTQGSAEERAWAAVTEAASEIWRERAREAEQELTREAQQGREHQQGGVPESIEDGPKSLQRAAQEKAHDITNGAGETKEAVKKNLSGDAKERLGETEWSARQKLEVVKERAQERVEEGWDETQKARDESERENDMASTIHGSMPIGIGNVTEAIRLKLTMPGDVVEHKSQRTKGPERVGWWSRGRRGHEGCRARSWEDASCKEE